MNKAKTKTAAKCSSVRIKADLKKKAKAILLEANSKKLGRKIKLDDLLEVALGLVAPEHIQQLQERSMTYKNRLEILRRRYIETRGHISEDDFIGFTMTAEFQDFKKEHEPSLLAA